MSASPYLLQRIEHRWKQIKKNPALYAQVRQVRSTSIFGTPKFDLNALAGILPTCADPVLLQGFIDDLRELQRLQYKVGAVILNTPRSPRDAATSVMGNTVNLIFD